MPGGPGNLQLFGIPHFDKIGHFGMYLVWAFLFYHAYSAGEWNQRKTFWMAVAAGALMGIVLEYGQKFMHQGRSFEAADMIANAVGALMGASAGVVFRRWKK